MKLPAAVELRREAGRSRNTQLAAASAYNAYNYNRFNFPH